MDYLLDHSNHKYHLPADFLDNIDDLAVVWIDVDTGDETLNYVYKDGRRGRVSATTWSEEPWSIRMYVGEYDIIVGGKWVVDEDKWNSRKTPYEFL